MSDKKNYWLEVEAERYFNRWKTNYLKYKRMDWNDCPTALRNWFKKLILLEDQKQKDMVTFREKQAKLIKKDDRQAMRDIKVGLDKRRIK